MKRSEKEAVVAQVADRISRAQAVVLTDFTGLKVEEITELRRQIKEAGQEYTVVKNRLFKRAIEGTEAAALAEMLVGPNGFGFSYNDPVALAKVLADFAKDKPALEVKGGILEGKIISPQEITALAKLPAREVLLSMMLGAMNGVPRNLVSVLAAVVRSLLNVLKAVEDQKAAEAA
ncbi:MAG: 50S ribosomal protein L10 [Desulfarculaceae bacterium]|jgi:large subunit ribosomal protein L10